MSNPKSTLKHGDCRHRGDYCDCDGAWFAADSWLAVAAILQACAASPCRAWNGGAHTCNGACAPPYCPPAPLGLPSCHHTISHCAALLLFLRSYGAFAA
ncbi:MAG TPA: hypothetical protein K8V47_01420 [Candidatus Amulumruptor caecigallinarius]|uniref:Uncharacterized protein n=1 Tax=Candidatus Amulumruptor caecigallinarius TaxID=2109911 RepID=A0A921JHK6_9BACT|nr:hypothetical protein [Candidatus Amulumruptor caecigallinarius]